MKLIPLTQSKCTQVDDEDLKYLMQYNWHAELKKGIWYAVRSKWIDNKYYSMFMHREIFLINNLKALNLIDHKDNDGLNNQKFNLRPATHSQNSANRGLQSNNTSGFIGVSYKKERMKFRAYIKYQGDMKELGEFDDPIKAAEIRDNAAKRLFGPFARLNFPE
jgi:hypothetical protein